MTGLTSCPGFLIVSLIIALVSIPVKTEIWSNEVSDIQYGALGSNVTLACGSSRGRPSVEWQLNGSGVGSSQTLLQNGDLVLINADLSMEGNYSCHDRRGNLLWATKLRLGYFPGFLNITCMTPNYISITCAWEQTLKTFLPTKYIMTYRDGGQRSEPCRQEFYTINSCKINATKIWHHNHLINITEVNPLGSKYTISKIEIHDIVKPDPPEEISVEPIIGQPTRLLVSWRYPASWSNEIHFQLNFQLRHKPVGSESWSKLKTTNTNVTVNDVLAGHNHIIQVQAIDYTENGHWSEWSPEVKALPWIEPTLPPSETSNYENVSEELDQSTKNKTTDISMEQYEKLGMLISLGLFAGVILALLALFMVFFWIKHRGKEEATKQELASMMKMKSVPI
ncbi:interleukin-11 receptor subunit alpha [Amia ocellicauda]|uniref:interleukin-11 receptor subunit alpha n=1 Tax=Amia ocellicauda TaxID=2972642 RepID=UPI0034646262